VYATFVGLAIGFIILTTGRQVYWLFAGGITLVSIFILTPLFLEMSQSEELLVIAILGGILVGLFSVLFGRPMVMAAAFLTGGFLAIMFPLQFGLSMAWINWIFYVLGGVISFILVLVWFDTMIIVLSAFAGSSLIIQTLVLGDFDRILSLIGIAVFGIAIQSILMRYYPEEIEG
jgi:hypothetical protein